MQYAAVEKLLRAAESALRRPLLHATNGGVPRLTLAALQLTPAADRVKARRLQPPCRVPASTHHRASRLRAVLANARRMLWVVLLLRASAMPTAQRSVCLSHSLSLLFVSSVARGLSHDCTLHRCALQPLCVASCRTLSARCAGRVCRRRCGRRCASSRCKACSTVRSPSPHCPTLCAVAVTTRHTALSWVSNALRCVGLLIACGRESSSNLDCAALRRDPTAHQIRSG